MVLDGSTYVPQPYYAYVRFYIGGKDLILEAGRPQHLISFTHSMKVNGTADWSLEIFDATFNFIEHELWELACGAYTQGGKQPEVTFRYGYTDGAESPIYHCLLEQVTPKWAYSGVTITLTGRNAIGYGAGRLVEHVPTLWYKRDRAFADISISDIVRKLAKENGYVIDENYFHETEPILLPHDLNSTNPIHKIFEQKGMSMEQFVKHYLLPYAVRKGSRIGGYIFYIDHRFKPPKVRFYVPELFPAEKCPEPLKRIYTIRKDKMEEWTEFSYDLTYGPAEATGAFEEAHFSIDPHTGEYVFEKYNPENQKKYIRKYGPAHRDPLYTDGMNNVRMRPSHSPALLQDERDNFHRVHLITKYRGVMKASLSVVGDPRDDLLPGEFIRVNNFLPDGSLHYSSGCYFVESIEHSISGGTYITSFSLQRNAAQENPPSSKSQDSGGVGT